MKIRPLTRPCGAADEIQLAADVDGGVSAQRS